MARRLAASLAALVLALAPAGANAMEPVLMFLLGFVQNRLNTLANERQPARIAPQPTVPVQPAPLAHKPLAEMNREDLRAVIDQSFVYLSRAQRAELLAGLVQVVDNPAHAGDRALILGQFLDIAHRVRFTHDTLDRLSPEQKRMVAGHFSDNLRAMDPALRDGLRAQLRARTLPVPADLSELMLGELAALR